ncbi:hypothetical protein [Streptomyces sp. NRRL WC-3725]|uniref:hypothetical protein n=1 Tax=Streptomyces sp. NRRL WC-3725 TaxID=1463933 RepID=UPI0006899E54|nr:hypothetical protein [Streptomyces sp. NRRL WC-3725]
MTEAGEGNLVLVRFPVTCTAGRFIMVTSVDDGLLQGLRLDACDGAKWRPPHYVDEDRFTEPDSCSAPAVRSPRHAHPARRRRTVARCGAAQGGGAFDRDESSGLNKPLKDLA